MEQHRTHAAHDHRHGAGCGHKTIDHDGHTDYVHDGHMHHIHGDHIDEHSLAIGGSNDAACNPSHACDSHEKSHMHGASCGHEAIPHGDHVDYAVDGHLHYAHGGHCDDHGAVRIT